MQRYLARIVNRISFQRSFTQQYWATTRFPSIPANNGFQLAQRSYLASATTSSTETSTIPVSQITERVLKVVKNFPKVNKDISETSKFTEDLGLDSLDTVELVLAFEDEFSVEIPDEEADKIQSVPQAVSYFTRANVK
jgi:NADH dehydrogenase (ubiquinone) 1 alpha/beta subcomplex 1